MATTSSPTTADVKIAVADQLKLLLMAKLGNDGYAEYVRLMDTLAGIERAEGIFQRGMYEPAAPAPPATPSQNDHVKTYRSSPTARERVRAYLAKHGPSRTRDIIRDTRVPAGTLSGLLNAASTEFASPSRGVWKLKNGK